jgi:copper(I)-binding protein
MNFTKLVLAFANQDNNDNKDLRLVSFTTTKKEKKGNLHRTHPWLCKTNMMTMKRSSSSPLPP